MPVISHVIFDMDGTLADTAKLTIPACAKSALAFALPPLSDAKIRETIGYANPEFYYRLYPELDRETALAFGASVEALEQEMVWQVGKAMLFPGIQTLLEALSGRNILLYVASTGGKRHVDSVLGATGIRAYFDAVCCGEPEKAGMVAEIIAGRPPEGWAMVGDKPHDLRAARANSIVALAARYGYCTEEDAALFDGALGAAMDLMDWI